MRKFLLLFNAAACMLLSIVANAQISQGGEPRSFDPAKANIFSAKVPVAEMSYVDVDALRAEDALVDQYKDRPWRFGENLYVDLAPSNAGEWINFPNGDRIWRLCIYSPGAISINLTFDQYRLPDGADLFVYNESRTDVIGAFTSQNNQNDGVFATSLVQGDKIYIEYFEPASVQFPGEIHLYRVTHGYRGIMDFAKAFGSSGSCNVNVACPGGVGWENEINSVCMLVSGGAGFCTGALINNTANDGTPYVLTADHCYSTPTSWVFYFNWQSATCPNPGASPAHDDISGAVLRARNAASDFCLVEMNSVPPSSYGVYYSGWNRTTNATIAGTIYGIHHPSADIKKISWTTLGLTTTSYLGTASPGDNSHWRITSWSDLTTTEGGSSGSPLFDPNHRIVGQLHGGYAACGNTDSDWYGKFGVSWTGGGTSSTRLSNWLDPASSGVTTLDGYDPNTPSVTIDAQVGAITQPTGSSCGTNSITPTVTLVNRGSTTLTSATVVYKIDNGTPVTQAWTGSLATNASAVITFPTVTASYAAHTITSWSTLPNGLADLNTANDTATGSFTLSNGTFTVPYVELFNSASFPPACWTSFIGTNGLGTLQNWKLSSTASEGTGAAYVQYENVSGGTAEDWLVTPMIQLINNSVLSFWQRQAYTTVYNSSYSIRVSTTSQTNIASFTTVSTWAEGTFGTSYSRKTVDLSAYNGQSVYIAFVMTNDDGDDWYVDSVKVNGTCINPVAAFSASATTTCQNNTITLTDASTNVPTSWAWTITPATYTFVGGTNASSQNPQVQFTAAGNYNIVLTATNSCGSDAETKNNYISVTAAPAQPSAISGNTAPCPNATGLVYSVTNVGGVTYNWSVPAGWNINAGAGTNTITVTAGTVGGTISVTPNNGCDGTAQTLSVSLGALPAQPSAIVGLSAPCMSNTETYSVTNVVGLSYNWTVPADWVINSGQTTSSINVTVGIQNGTIEVTPSNSCGAGTSRSLSVVSSVAPSQPSAISGDPTPCEGTSVTYSVTNVAGMTYAWSLPAGYTQTGGGTTNTIDVDVTSGSGTISVTPSNGCGTGLAQTLSVSSGAYPIVSIGNDTTICDDEILVLDAGSGYINYEWSTGDLTQTTSIDGSVVGLGYHNYSVTVTSPEGCDGVGDINIDVQNCSNIDEHGNIGLFVYPNPANDQLNIHFYSAESSILIELYDVQGKCILREKQELVSAGNELALDLSNLKSGIYNVRIVTNNGYSVNRIVVE